MNRIKLNTAVLPSVLCSLMYLKHALFSNLRTVWCWRTFYCVTIP